MKTLQGMFRDRFNDDDSFLDKLSETEILNNCRKETVTEAAKAEKEAPAVAVVQAVAEEPKAAVKRAIFK